MDWAQSCTSAKVEIPPIAQDALNEEDAWQLVEAFLERHLALFPGRAPLQRVEFAIGNRSFWFGFDRFSNTLTCRVLIHRFHGNPTPEIKEALDVWGEIMQKDTPDFIAYQTERIGLFLHRSYDRSVSKASFIEDMENLLFSSSDWFIESLKQVLHQLISAPSSQRERAKVA